MSHAIMAIPRAFVTALAGRARQLHRWCLPGLLGLSACAPLHIVSPQDPQTLLPDHSTVIAVGQNARGDVRRALGEPVLSSQYWGFDLFLRSAEQTDTLIAVTPWPVPFMRVTDQLERHTLVAYDASGRVGAVATGLFRRPASWRKATPIDHDHPWLHLRAAELAYFVHPDGERAMNLFVTPARRNTYLQDAQTSARCTLVLGCADGGCADQVSIDAGPQRTLALRTPMPYWLRPGERERWLDGVQPVGRDAPLPWIEALEVLALGEGPHELAFSARHLDGGARFAFTCRPGTVSYLKIEARANEKRWRTELVDWRFDHTAVMPERFMARPLVLVDDGRWAIGAEAPR